MTEDSKTAEKYGLVKTSWLIRARKRTWTLGHKRPDTPSATSGTLDDSLDFFFNYFNVE